MSYRSLTKAILKLKSHIGNITCKINNSDQCAYLTRLYYNIIIAYLHQTMSYYDKLLYIFVIHTNTVIYYQNN